MFENINLLLMATVALYEIMVLSDNMRTKIVEGSSSSALKQMAISEGMRTLRGSGGTRAGGRPVRMGRERNLRARTPLETRAEQPTASEQPAAAAPPSQSDTSAAAPAARIEDLWVTYRRGSVAVDAVRGITLDIPTGDFLAIQGPSGSGKSTLLRAVAGLCPATSGRVLLDGTPLDERSDAELAVLRRRSIGFVHQLFNLLPDLTAAENVGLPLMLDGRRDRDVRQRVASALDRLGIGNLASRRPEELSGGEMLRVALARALVIEPLLILADEPTGSLDSKNGRRVLELFQQAHAAGDLTLVVVTHDADVAAAAQRTLHIVDGQLQD